MRILITGATGFIGSRLVKLLDRHQIFAICRQNDPRFGPNVTYITQNLSHGLDLSKMPESLDAIVHLAQSRFDKQFPDQANEIFEVNLQSTFHLLEYARRSNVKQFIYTSTGGVYGLKPNPCLETDPFAPMDFYAASKVCSELLIAKYQPFFHTIILRPFFVYGPGQEKRLFPILLDRIQRGAQITIEGEDGIRINPIHVNDVLRVLLSSLELSNSGVVNVAGDETVTIAEIVGRLSNAAGKTANVRRTKAQPQGNLIGDNRRMKQMLNVTPAMTLAEGVKNLAAS